MTDKFDFSGYVTKYDILCCDDKIIAKNAFDECNNKVVPLINNFYYADMPPVLGHVILEGRPDGVYGYCKFNEHPIAKTYRMLVKEHIFKDLGIYANKITLDTDNIVKYGDIQAVALVRYGSNPGAYIDYYADERKQK